MLHAPLQRLALRVCSSEVLASHLASLAALQQLKDLELRGAGSANVQSDPADFAALLPQLTGLTRLVLHSAWTSSSMASHC